jgi:hypothetical protein
MNESPFEDSLENESCSIQNIKRRIYDVLNVFLAVGIIKKVGFKITNSFGRKNNTIKDSRNSSQRYFDFLNEKDVK